MGAKEIKSEWLNLKTTINRWKEDKKSCRQAKKDKRSVLEREVDEATEVLYNMPPWSHEYSLASRNIERLAKAQAEMDEAKAKANPKAPRSKLDLNTVLTVGGSLAALGAVIWSQMDHEEGGLGLILPQKDLGFVPKIGRR